MQFQRQIVFLTNSKSFEFGNLNIFTGLITKNFRVYLMPSSPELSLFENGLWTRVAVRTQEIVIHFFEKSYF